MSFSLGFFFHLKSEYNPPTIAITNAKGSRNAKKIKITARNTTNPNTIKKKYTQGLVLAKRKFIMAHFFFSSNNLIV